MSHMMMVSLGIFSKNLAEDSSINPVFASWLSTIVMLPIGIYLCYIAAYDKAFLPNPINFIKNIIKR